MNRYIKIENGTEIGHPISEENLRYIFEGEIPKDLELHGFRKMSKEEIEVSLDQAKKAKKAHLSELFRAKSLRHKVDTGLGYEVDGGKEDLVNLEVVKDLKITQIKLANNEFKTLKEGDIDKIISAVKLAGAKRYQEKWEWEAKIDAAKTITELEAIDIEGAFGTETV